MLPVRAMCMILNQKDAGSTGSTTQTNHPSAGQPRQALLASVESHEAALEGSSQEGPLLETFAGGLF
jgi:hypothetical protein